MVAHIAGLGWIGKNCLLITPTRGPRLRLVSILTNAPLDTVDGQMEQRCGDCLECAQACPAGAIKGRNYVSGESRDVRLDFFKCQQYIEDARKSTGYAVCGMCLYACPYGKQRLKT
jgi:epoxyqueuosine reductase QueG